MSSSFQPPSNDLDRIAAGEIDARDLATLERLADVFDTIDGVPAGLVDRIHFGLTLDALNAEVAQLQRVGELAGARGGDLADGVHSITFTTAALSTMIHVSAAGHGRVRIDGWVAPGGGVAVELRATDATYSTTADGDGRFVFADVPKGLAQFVLRPPEPSIQPVVITPSLEL